MIIAITGFQGSGKTAVMSFLLYLMQNQGKKLITNYNLDLPHIEMTDEMFKDKEVLMEVLEKLDAKDGLAFGIDEIHLILDARGAMQNRKKSFIMTQARKVLEENGIFFYTTQFYMQIDVRLRFNTLYLLKVDKVYHNGELYFKVEIFRNDGEFQRNTHRNFYLKASEIFKLKLYEKFEIIGLNE